MRLDIIRGGSLHPIQAGKDVYDSTADLINDNGETVIHLDNVSTIPSRILFDQDQLALHGIIAPGSWKAIWIKTPKLGEHFVYYHGDIKNENDLTDEMITFPSLKPNPSMGGKMIVSSVCFHDGCRGNNGSEACTTVFPDDWETFTKLFKLGDIIDVTLTDSPNYKYPVV